jgi:acyl-CoA dehydrogenase
MDLSQLLFGILHELPTAVTVIGIIVLVLALGYAGAALWLWTLATAVVLWGLGAPVWVWVIFVLVASIFNVRPLRKNIVTRPLMKGLDALGMLPTIGQTERIALESGTTWIEGGFFSGMPDFDAILQEPYPDLTAKERAFLEGPVTEVCRMTDDWAVRQRDDLSEAVWDYLKKEGFFGMVIPETYGGLGFSARGMNAVVAKLGSRSIPLAVDVMVPNSLGPAELLIHYGTEEQKEHYLPRLARGEDIPCFALTESDAGSDAAAIDSSGVVFEGEDGKLYLRLNWEKRYITLAAVSTLLGLAFQLEDPDNLLGKGERPGITVALIPTDLDGVETGHRHNPLYTPFINSPTEGHDVIVPVDQIIGGPDQAGQGWRMLMETLAAGRGIFLPAMNNGGAKFVSRISGAYAQVRQQFGLPIGRFEGIEELLAPIGGLTYILDALSTFTCGALDEGAKPPVISAIAKYSSSEFNRLIVNYAMDLHAGKSIVMGPRNLLGNGYIAVPIAITVEGSNIVTRSLIIFGQGLIRSHPYALKELTALEDGDVDTFDEVVWQHAGMIINNFFRASLLALTRGYLAGSPVSGPTADYYRKLSWAAAEFSLTADIALMTLGGSLKSREKLSGRFADMLSWLYLATCALRKFEAEGRREADLPLVQWAVEYALSQIQAALEGIYGNFPVPGLGWLMRHPISWLLRLNPIGMKPADVLGSKVAELLQEPGEARDRLTADIFIPDDSTEPLAQLERAFLLAQESAPLYRRIRGAVKDGTLLKARPKRLVDQAFEAQVINREEYQLLQETEEARQEAVRVDAYPVQEENMRRISNE